MPFSGTEQRARYSLRIFVMGGLLEDVVALSNSVVGC